MNSDFEEVRPSFVARLAAMRFVSFSLLLHALLVLLAGSVVIFKNIVAAPDFVAGEGDLISVTETPRPPDPEPTTASMVVPVPKIQPSSMDVVASTSTTNTAFQVPTTSVVSRLETKLTMAEGTKLGDSIKNLSSGGVPGGMARSFFGSKAAAKTTGLVGNLYDGKQYRDKKPSNVDVGGFSNLVTKFVEQGWRESILREYYKAPSALSATQIFIPNMPADEGPKAFEVDKEVQPSRWLVHYKGKVSPPHDGDYRFVGAGDDYLVVRINGKLVLDHGFAQATKWQPDKYYDYGFTDVPKGFAHGDKFHAVAGQYYDMDILISELPGGLVFFCLLVEEEGVTYEKDPNGNPILPIFRLADLPLAELKPGQTLPPFVKNGPVWKTSPADGSGMGMR